MKTIRRDLLLRLARAGKLVLVGSYSFDDQHGSDVIQPGAARPGDAEPAARGLVPTGGHVLGAGQRVRGQARPRVGEHNGTVTLYVHSNSNYDFRVLT